MAFMGVLLVIIGIGVVFGAFFFLGIVPIIIGTILIRKKKHPKAGVALRIFGYIIIIPLLTIAGLTIWLIYRTRM